jgi:Skp family chaperone for outer membrane proteins
MKKRRCLFIVLVCACLLQAHSFTLVAHRASPTRKVGPVAASRLAVSSSKTSVRNSPLVKFFKTYFGSFATLFSAAVSAFMVYLVKINSVSADVQDLSTKRENNAKRELEALDRLEAMVKKTHQTYVDFNNRATEVEENHKAMWSAFWKNLAIEFIVVAGSVMVYAAYLQHYKQ